VRMDMVLECRNAMRPAAIIFCVAALWTATSALGDPSASEQADSLTLRLPPSAFPKLPAPVRAYLQARGFRVPQPFCSRSANVISGQFAHRGQTDWAVLASRGRVSTILVFWGGATRVVDTLASCPDRTYLQAIESGEIGFSRCITPTTRREIRGLYDAFAGGTRPGFPIDHDGIEDSFVEKGSVVRSRRDGKWEELAGAD
jgi:hypothetical protein